MTRAERPAGARAEHSAVPAGYQGDDARAKWKAALAAHNAALRRGARRPRGGKYRAGMARRMPPEPDGDDAA